MQAFVKQVEGSAPSKNDVESKSKFAKQSVIACDL